MNIPFDYQGYAAFLLVNSSINNYTRVCFVSTVPTEEYFIIWLNKLEPLSARNSSVTQ